MVLSAYSFGLHDENSSFTRTGCDWIWAAGALFPAFHGVCQGHLAGVTADTMKNPEAGILWGPGDSKRDLQRHGLGYGMGSVIDIQLSQDFLDVVFDGKRADVK